eukprot:1714284-Prymnesium_polylepis.2
MAGCTTCTTSPGRSAPKVRALLCPRVASAVHKLHKRAQRANARSEHRAVIKLCLQVGCPPPALRARRVHEAVQAGATHRAGAA